jgi:hypothetical protein
MRSVALTLALAVVTCCTADGAAPPKVGKKGGKKAAGVTAAATDLSLVSELRQAFRVLDRAEPIYHGHRARAREEINHAIGQLQKEMHKHGLKEHHHGDKVKEPVNVSNAQVAESAREVKDVLAKLTGLPTTPHRAKAAAHLGTAVTELDRALAWVKNNPPKKK